MLSQPNFIGMKREFTVAFFGLLLASGIMWATQPETGHKGKIPLLWTSDDNPLRKDQMALFNREHPSDDLEIDPMNQGIEKVIVQSLAGVGPDLIDCRDANQLAAYVKAGIAWDVTDELAKQGVDVNTQVWSCTVPLCVQEGRVYGVPTNAAANAIWINKDAFAAANIPVPKAGWTWAQFIPLAQKLTLRDSEGHPKQFGFLLDWWNERHFAATFGGKLFTPDGTRCTLDSPGNVAALQLMHDLVYKYKVTPSPVEESGMASAGGWGSGTINIFGAKRAAMALGGRWWLANMRTFSGLNLTTVESPYGTVRACSAAGRATLINVKSPHREEALKFLLYLASPQYGELVNNQADGIAAFKADCFKPSFEHNPAHPEETYNDAWRDATSLAVQPESSPYVNGQVVQRILDKQVDLVRVDAKTAQQAMTDAASEINAEIVRSLKEDPGLMQRWVAATGHPL
jgi:multiple sugar transport system substrate-binding protein